MKIFEKLGIYDLVVVLLSGISMLTFTFLILQTIYDIPIKIDSRVNDTLSFLVISYFLGLVFQELGSILQKKITHKNNKLLKSALNTLNVMHTSLTKTEILSVYSYVVEKLNLIANEDNDNIVYNYCKFYIIKYGDTDKIDKDQYLSAMSRSLSLYFTLLTFIAIYDVIFVPSLKKLILIFISLLLAILLYYRCIRFAKLRYIYIIRTFYYEVVK